MDRAEEQRTYIRFALEIEKTDEEWSRDSFNDDCPIVYPPNWKIQRESSKEDPHPSTTGSQEAIILRSVKKFSIIV